MMPRNHFPNGYDNFEENHNDPLANVEQFNIIQFLDAGENEFGLPLEEPLVVQNNFSQMKHDGMVVQDPHHTNNGMYQMMAGKLPNSPSNTDSGSGSTASPSSNSDPPYSPDTFANYGLGGRRIADSGLILGLNDIRNENMRPQFDGKRGNRANQQLSPECFMSPYPPSQQPTPQSYAQSVSPDENQRYAQGHFYNSMNTSSEGSLNSQNSDAPTSRKRQRFDGVDLDPTTILHAALGGQNPTASSPVDSYMGEDMSQPTIKFSKYQEETWGVLYDIHGRELNHLQIHVVADKGFNYSTNDTCFVNQKKNHFQVSVHVEASDAMPPKMIRHNGSLHSIKEFKISFTGVKSELPSSEICIRQSRTDRKPHPHTPVLFEIQERRMTKVTVPRLHFSETTLNNQRKNLRPNPEQRYFLLVAKLSATTVDNQSILVQSYASERVIVRATNPGSFEPPESDISWNKNASTLYTNGPVAIGSDRAIGKLTVDGDIYTTGRVICPSDIRLKENITEKAAREALNNLCKLRIVDYFYKPEVAAKWGLTEEQRKRTGVIAQELAAVLPDAVRDIGDYLTVNESRVFYETVLATQELCRLTGDLDMKIDEKVEEISQRLAQYAARKKLTSRSSNLNKDGMYDKDSIMSYSRSSVASTATTIKNPRRKRSSPRNTETVCGSKMAQGTIVTLVGIMALCLLTMSSLYVLDWHNRNYGYHYSSDASKPEKKTTDGPGNMVLPGESMPIYQPDAPPIMPNCPSPGCRTHCCDQPIDMVESDNDQPPQSSWPVSRSDFLKKSFGTGITITLPQFAMTIDQRYCIEKSCNSRRQIYNLFVPMSKYFPPIPVEVQIKAPASKIINNCGSIAEFHHKKCSAPNLQSIYIPDTPISSQILENVYELRVGAYIQSAYRFRIAYDTLSCFSGEEGGGGIYEEYNLVFYRDCNGKNATESKL